MNIDQNLAESPYLQYIPIIFENPTANAIVLMIIPAFFYILAAYGHIYYKDLPVVHAILMSILFASIEYVFRVPVNKYAHDVVGLSTLWTQLIWVVLTMFMAHGLDVAMS